MMTGGAQRSGKSGPNPVWMEIGRHLARVCEGDLGSPLPERFVQLLRQLDAREQLPFSNSSRDSLRSDGK
jgi:hypothetical protein